MDKQAHLGFFIEDWRVLPAEGLLTRGNETERLEPKAMEVLAYLASRPGEVVTREELERDVWHGALVGYDAVTNTVIKLRKALKDNARQPRYIATIPKKGYKLIAPITYPKDEESTGPVMPFSQAAETNVQQGGQSPSKYRASMLIAVLVGVVALSLVWLWPSAPLQTESVPPSAVENKAALPSIIVLPFENLGDDPNQEYLADGITEDIITDLSRLSNLQIFASNTSYNYKGRQITPEKLKAELNVDFVLKGSIRRLGDSIRVNAQLVNTTTGFNVWAERYEKKATEVFALQDEVTQNIIKALAINLTDKEKRHLAKRSTSNLDAYDLFQEGQQLSKTGTKGANQQAREVYRNAIKLDPTYGRAYGALAYIHAFNYRRGWTDSPQETLDRALALAEQAVALDSTIPQTYWALGYVYLMRKEFDKAEKAVAQAINIAPSYADGYGLLALISNNLGHAKEAIKYITKGMQLNPYYTWDYPYNLGCAYYLLGDYDAAITALEKAQERNENAVPIKLYLAASYAKANRQDDAEWAIDELQMLSPAATISHTEKTVPIAQPEIKRVFLQDLRKAGLPE
jgi:TolB-like protein/DNA-binding winged helix-turn-helix (wHTH) protein/Tfp pilus assembly protein PilF